jgi:hypothetical protein
VNAVLKDVHVDNNAGIGVKADATGGTCTVNVLVVDSVVSSSIGSNIAGFTTAGTGIAYVMINRASLSASQLGVRSDGPATTVRIGNSEIFGNVNGVFSANGGTLQSYGDNQLNGNANDGVMGTIGLH